MSIEQNISMKRGDTRVLQFRVQDKLGNPVDLAGAVGEWWFGFQAKYTKRVLTTAAVKKLSKTIEFGTAQHEGRTFYVITIYLDPDDTKDEVPDSYYHEAEITKANSAIETVVYGRFVLQNDFVRRP